MSDYGMIIKNNSSQIQIDSTYKNFTLHSTYSGTFNSVAENFAISPDVLDWETENIMVAFIPVDSCFIHQTLLRYGAYDTPPPTYYWIGPTFSSDNAGSFTFYWALFREGQTNPAPSSDYGLIIYNSNGDIVYHSNDEPFKIIDIYTGSLPTGDDYDNIDVEDTGNYFMMLPTDCYYFEVSSGWYQRFTRGLKKIDSNTVRIGQFMVGEGGTGLDDGMYDDAWVNDYVVVEIEIL